MPRTASSAVPDLLGVLKKREAQARAFSRPYVQDVHARDTMRYWIAQACKQAREAAGRKLVHVGASADRDQSTVYRFEQNGAWPRDADEIVNAYADDLDIEAFELWEQALKMWRAHRDGANISALAADERAARATERPAPRTRGPRPAARKAPSGGQPDTPGR